MRRPVGLAGCILFSMAIAQVSDVAHRAGVSPATVSNALNHPEKVSPRTRERVHAAIEELGYVRNDAARQLRQRGNRAVGMILLDVGNPFFAGVARGAELDLAEHGRPLLLGNSAQQGPQELKYLSLFEEQRVAGILVTPVGNILSRLRRIKQRGTAVVIVDRKAGAKQFSSVSADDRHGGRVAAEHLISLGRRRIAVVGGPPSIRQVSDRLAGAESAAQEHSGVTVEYVNTGGMDSESGRIAAREFLTRGAAERPDAIFAANDLVALGALQELARAGVAVPDDMALVGYDDIEFAESSTVPITSVRQPAEDMGRSAAQLLLSALEHPDAAVQHPTFTPELVVRQSTVGV